jgi:predicted RNase H-related nuclease YkuK (DUF458 family)
MTENWEQQNRRMDFECLTDELASLIRSLDQHASFRLIVGTDSQPSVPIRFETVVVLVMPGQIRSWNRRLATMGPMALVERMLTETAMSLMVAEAICSDMEGRGLPAVRFGVEIHADVGPKGGSRRAMREAVGMVTGAGFAVRVKPESWAASRVADRLTKQECRRPVLPVYELVTAM